MKPSVYIESSVVSYLAAWPSRDLIVAARQAITDDWWTNHRDRFVLRISALVEQEISAGDEDAAERRRRLVADIPSLEISNLATQIAERLMTEGAVPRGSESDALHIGIAAAQGTDYLMTWNFRHMNNAERKAAIEDAVESMGVVCPRICSPDELVEAPND